MHELSGVKNTSHVQLDELRITNGDHKKGVCNFATRKKRILRKKCVTLHASLLYRVSERAYNQKSGDLEICHL